MTEQPEKPFTFQGQKFSELFTIKKLEWEWAQGQLHRGFSVNVCGFSAWVYQERTHKMAAWSPWTIDATNHQTADCASPEEGKQLAEEHWQEYMKQGLLPAPDGPLATYLRGRLDALEEAAHAAQQAEANTRLASDAVAALAMNEPARLEEFRLRFPAAPTADSIRAAAEEVSAFVGAPASIINTERIAAIIARHCAAKTEGAK